MPQVNIPESLFREVEKVLPNAASLDEFIATAVREKLTFEGQKREFYRLSNQTRAALAANGLTDFESARQPQNG
jgi:hypothetical protein